MNQIFLAPIGVSNVARQLQSLFFHSSRFGGMWLPFVQSSVFSDTSGTTRITEGAAAARIDDLSGNGLHFLESDAAKRPDWTAGKLVSNGTTDSMQIASANFSVSNLVTVIAIYKRTGTSSGILLELGANTTSVFAITTPTAATNNHAFRARGASDSNAISASSYASPDGPAVYVGQGGAGIDTRLNRDDVIIARAATTNPAAWISSTLNLFARNRTSVFAAVELHALIVVAADVSTQDIERGVALLSQSISEIPTPASRNPRRIRNAMFSWWTGPYLANNWVASTNAAGDINVTSIAAGTTVALDNQSKDDHNAPAIINPPGKVPLAIWARRSSDSLFWKKGTVEGDFSTLGSTNEKVDSVRTSYTRAFYLGGDKVIVFSRRASNGWKYFLSTDYGDTFGDAVHLLSSAGAELTYATFAQMSDTRFRVAAYTHPTDLTDRKIYYFEIDFDTGAITEADGTAIGNISTDLPLTTADMEVAYDGNSDATVDQNRLFCVSDGPEPEIGFVGFSASVAEYRYMVYRTGGWEMKTIGNSGAVFGYTADVGYYGGIATPTQSPGGVFYISREESGSRFIEKKTTVDYGDNWVTEVMRRSDVTKLIRPMYFDGQLMYVDAAAYGASFTDWASDVFVASR